MKSALFVDFDNVYTQLRALQPAAAERFARQPIEWMRWLTDALGVPDGHDPTARRRLLVRRCYLNPNWYQQYRHAFLRAGFEIVDCPPVTSQGKTSTDIHMVLDIVELLQHETRYDEFIVLSADADFTPVLRKLRRWDRRTTVLAIGFPSAAYQASADLLIDERQFIEQALGLAADTADAPDLPAPRTAPPELPQDMHIALPARAPSGLAQQVLHAAPASAPGPLTATQLADIARAVATAVAQSPQPVAASRLAARLRQDHGALLDGWNGHGQFKPFFLALGLDSLVWLNGSGGRIADPARLEAGSAASADAEPPADSLWAGHEALLPVAREVCQLTGAPLLAPPVVRAVLQALCDDLADFTYEPTETAQQVRNICLERTPPIDVPLRDVVFLLRGMQLNGHVFGQGQDDVQTLAKRLLDQVLFLCQREQMQLDAGAHAQIAAWIAGTPQGTAAA